MTPTETSSSIRRKKDRVIGRGGPGSESTHAMPTGREAYPDVCLVANQSKVVPIHATCRKPDPKTERLTHLELGRASLVADEEEVAVSVDDDLLLEAAALGALLLHVGAGQVAVHERRLAGGQRPHDAQPDVGHAAGQRPLLAVDERICKDKKCNRFMGAVLSPVDSAVKRDARGLLQTFCNIFSIEKSLCCREQAAKKYRPALVPFRS